MTRINHLKKAAQRYAVSVANAALSLGVLTSCGGSSSGNENPTPSSPTSSSSAVNSSSSPTVVSAATSAYTSKSVRLSWDIPTTRADNTPISVTELAGYEIAYLASDGVITHIPIDDPLTTSHIIANLAPDDYRFFVFSYDSENRTSAASEVVALALNSFSVK